MKNKVNKKSKGMLGLALASTLIASPALASEIDLTLSPVNVTYNLATTAMTVGPITGNIRVNSPRCTPDLSRMGVANLFAEVRYPNGVLDYPNFILTTGRYFSVWDHVRGTYTPGELACSGGEAGVQLNFHTPINEDYIRDVCKTSGSGTRNDVIAFSQGTGAMLLDAPRVSPDSFLPMTSPDTYFPIHGAPQGIVFNITCESGSAATSEGLSEKKESSIKDAKEAPVYYKK